MAGTSNLSGNCALIAVVRTLIVAMLMVSTSGCLKRFPETRLFAPPFSQATLKSRLEERFRVGGPEAGLAEYLISQGFNPERTIVGEEANYVVGRADLYEGWGFCDDAAQVRWRANSKGVLTRLLVLYGNTGCF